MRLLTAAELTRFQLHQGYTLNDTCRHLTRLVAQDQYGLPDVTWVDALIYACGFEPMAKDEAMAATEVPMVDAKLRLPLALETVIEPTDRVKITHRHGVAVASPESFEIVGLPERGPSGLVYNLKRVTDGS